MKKNLESNIDESEKTHEFLFEHPAFGLSKVDIWCLKHKKEIDKVLGYVGFGIAYGTFLYGSFMTGYGLGQEIFF